MSPRPFQLTDGLHRDGSPDTDDLETRRSPSAPRNAADGLILGPMGTFHVPVAIGDLQGIRFESVDALVDTGATYMRMPGSLLARLGVQPQESRPFRLADNREVNYEVGQAMVRMAGRTLFTIIIFGEEGSEPLLGAVTLEQFGLGVDPVARRLIPVPGLLM